MKNLQDNEFKRLKNAVSLSRKSKETMKSNILNVQKKQKNNYFPKLLSVLVTIFAIGLIYVLIIDPLTESQEMTQGEIIDNETPETLPEVEVSDDMYTMEWLSDSMDRGNHDLITSEYGNLVISNEIQSIERGNIVHYQYDQQQHIGRVIGLPGETVMIQEGQVYIDDQKLNAFYGAATSLGLAEEEYFEKAESENVNIKGMKEYFNTSMNPVKVEEDKYFILIDMWWRGKDSREFGLIYFEQLEGIVVGYEK